MSDDDNVIPIHPPLIHPPAALNPEDVAERAQKINEEARAQEDADKPDWLKTADALGRDFEQLPGTPLALDEGIPATQFFSPGRPLHQAFSKETLDLEPALRESLRERGIDPAKPEPINFFYPASERQVVTGNLDRAELIDPLRKWVLGIALGLAALIFITSGVFTFAATASVAEWMKAPWPWLAWVVPGFIEAWVIFLGIDAIVSQARSRPKDSKVALRWMVAFAGVGVVANAAHTYAAWLATGEIPWNGYIGIAMSALAPLSVILITKRVSKLVFVEG